MTKALSLINGIGRMMTVVSEDSGVYDETYVVPEGGINSYVPVTLPNSGVYYDKDLTIFLRGQLLEPGLDFGYEGVGLRTQVYFRSSLQKGDRVHFRVEGTPTSIYDEVIVVDEEGIGTGEDITLPNDKDFNGDDLEVYLNGQYLEPDIDYMYIGLAPYEKIEMTFDLLENDRLRFRIG